MIKILDFLCYFLLIIGVQRFVAWFALYRRALMIVRNHPLGYLMITKNAFTKRRYW